MSLTFYQRVLVAPKQIGAVSPSGARLAEIITSDITAQTNAVVELGPGTGVFTRAILNRGIRPENLTALELDPIFARDLKLRFPGVQVLNLSAAELGRAVTVPEGGIGAVVSGLPLLSMPDQVQEDILDGAFSLLRPGGAFYQFTYYWFTPVPRRMLAARGLTARVIGRTLRNLPPARVYKFTRLADAT